jgi:hypothetical protein
MVTPSQQGTFPATSFQRGKRETQCEQLWLGNVKHNVNNYPHLLNQQYLIILAQKTIYEKEDI